MTKRGTSNQNFNTTQPFDQPVDRQTTSSQKWEKYRDTDILPMWVADTDFMAPPAVIEALQARVDHGIFGYTNTPAELSQLIIERIQNLYNWTIQEEWLVPVTRLTTLPEWSSYTGRVVSLVTGTGLWPQPWLTPTLRQARRGCHRQTGLPAFYVGSPVV